MTTIHYRRFTRTDRLLHGVLMFSFLGLAFTRDWIGPELRWPIS